MADEEKKSWFPHWIKALFAALIAVGGWLGGGQIEHYVKGEPGFFEQQALIGLDRRTTVSEGDIRDIRIDVREMRGKFDLIQEKLQDILDRLPLRKNKETITSVSTEKKDGG